MTAVEDERGGRMLCRGFAVVDLLRAVVDGGEDNPLSMMASAMGRQNYG